MRSIRNVAINRGMQGNSHLCAKWRREHSIVPRVDRPEHGDSRQDDLVGELLAERLHPRWEVPAGKGIVPRRHRARIHDLLVSLVHAVSMPTFERSGKCAIVQIAQRAPERCTRPGCTRADENTGFCSRFSTCAPVHPSEPWFCTLNTIFVFVCTPTPSINKLRCTRCTEQKEPSCCWIGAPDCAPSTAPDTSAQVHAHLLATVRPVEADVGQTVNPTTPCLSRGRNS